jgi:rare lipoprotein A (peptidoglycan hydrolase)
MANRAFLAVAMLLLAAPLSQAQQDRSCVREPLTPHCTDCNPEPQTESAPADLAVLRYAGLESEHKLSGLASYYSTFFDGRQTANGEIYRNRKFSAAHLTLPLGCWIEVTARATGKKLRMRVNDRGPFAKKFFLDLSQAAARFLGVDVTEDRHVEAHIIALPGEEPPPETIDVTEPAAAIASATPTGH